MSTYNILDFGAKGNDKTNDAKAIQSAIDKCTKSGGGTVLVPAGHTFLSGTLELKSNVELHLERGTTLLASSNYADYPNKLDIDILTDRLIVEDEFPKRAFIVAFHANNIAITGGGIIDGQGHAFIEKDLGDIYEMRPPNPYKERPFTLYLIGCNNLTMRDLTIKDAAFWTVRLTGCNDVVINGIRIANDTKLPNNDGIDLDCCKNVAISDCHIVAGDDGICLKTCRSPAATFGACENITVTNCTIMSTSTPLNVGCECRQPIRNVIFDSCVIHSSHRGLGVHLNEESNIENVLFQNMIIETRIFSTAWWGRGEPIYISAAPWVDKVGHIRNIRFVNVIAHSENSVFIHGSKPGLIENILLENIRLEIDKWSKVPGGQYDIRPFNGKGIIDNPTAGFYIQNATNVTMRNCEVVWGKNRQTYFRHALEIHNAANLIIENFQGESAFPDKFPAVLRD